MDAISQGELRNNTSAILARVAAEESIAVTNHGDVAAVLIPPNVSVFDRLLLAGSVRRHERRRRGSPTSHGSGR